MLAIFEQVCSLTDLPPIILHLAKPEEEETHLAAMAEADVILAQNTADSFHLPHLRSTAIKSAYPDTLIWPNVFYSGQQPFLRYFTHADQGRLMGPLEALHDLRLFARWARDRGVLQSDPIDEAAFAEQVRDMSLLQLQQKEANCDVTITDFITAHRETARLFFTFNHPTRLVLSELANRLTTRLGLEVDIPPGPEALNRYIVPSLWPGETAKAVDESYRGDGYALEDNGTVRRLPGPARTYGATELEQAFYEVYDHNPAFRDIARLRFTPNFPFDPIFSKL